MNLLSDLFKGWNLLAGTETRVQTLLGHPAIFQRPLTSLIDGDDIRATKSKVGAQRRAFLVLLAFDHNPHDPTPGSAPFPGSYHELSIRILDHSDVNVYHDGSDYYPHLEVTLTLYELGDETLGLYTPIDTLTSEDTGSLHQTVDLDLELSNETFTIPLYTQDSGATGSMTITATEYWPHEKLDGTANFHTATGLRI